MDEKKKWCSFFSRQTVMAATALIDKDPKQWGPAFWVVLDTIADAYPEGDTISEELKQQTETFFGCLQTLLPCAKCRQHYQTYVSRFPITAATKQALVQWITALKSAISASLVNPVAAPVNRPPVAPQVTRPVPLAQSMKRDTVLRSTISHVPSRVVISHSTGARASMPSRAVVSHSKGVRVSPRAALTPAILPSKGCGCGGARKA